MEKILEAFKFAEMKHKGQKRRVSNTDYISHPLIVSYLLCAYKKSKNIEDLIISCLLHDVLEDTNTTSDEITKKFGNSVCKIVEELTNDPVLIKSMGKNEYLKQKLLKVSSYALTIKLIDRLANISDNPTPKYVSDTSTLIVFLEKNRKINKTQELIINDIKEKISFRC